MKTYSIVGANFCKAEDVVKALQPGADLTLVREPSNQFDANAIAVWFNGQRIGYVPKKNNVALAAFIDQTGADWQTPINIAQDGSVSTLTGGGAMKSIPAKFVRSPNSGFPQCQILE